MRTRGIELRDDFVNNNSQSFMNTGWSSGLCDCCGENGNLGFCCLSCVCGELAQAILLKDMGLTPSCSYPFVFYSLLDCASGRSFLPLILTSLRMSVSDKLKRNEGPCRSLCVSLFCYACALAQMDRDLKAKGRQYAFDEQELHCYMSTSYIGAIHGSVKPYVSSLENAPLVTNGMSP